MGHVIERMALTKGHEVLVTIDNEEEWNRSGKLLGNCEVVIDFSLPHTTVTNILHCFEMNLPVVEGTTGWYDRLEEVKDLCRKKKQAIIVAPNFSIGINIMFHISRQLAKIMDKTAGYNITLEEIHHIHKIDSPSGTAINLAKIILEETSRKKKWVNQTSKNPSDLQIISRREDEIPGIHTMRCISDEDTIELTHTAKGREGFASGAILAAEWIIGKKGFFEMKDLLNFRE